MKTTEERIKALEAELQQLKQDIKPTFEAGKWYKCPYDGYLVCCQDPYAKFNSGHFGFGFGSNGVWIESGAKDKSLIPATESEVFEALKKEAIKRGFKVGVTVDATNITNLVCKYYTLSKQYGFEITKDYGDTTLRLGGSPIFANGIWAEIIKDEPIKIGGYEVKLDHKGKESECIIIGCKVIGRKRLEGLRDLMEFNKFESVKFGDFETVSLETINKILKL